ncbi:MAG: hypothetical protein Kow00121_26690 [Elainellaceae cyanobacterium]
MTTSPSSDKDLNPFGKLLSLLALLAAALYFTGWIYRWAYYGFFQLEVTTLNLPFESFYLASFQVLFGHPLTIARTIFVVLVTGVVILYALKLGHWVTNRFLRSRLLSLKLASTSTLRFLAALVDELIIVLLIVTALFWMAQWQARADAWRDAVNATSSLPVITIVVPEEEVGLGRQLDNPLVNPSKFRIIGDRGLYDRLLGKELTDTEDPEEPRVWRLLLDRDGYFYIFPALPTKDRFLSVPVLIVYESSKQITILSPNPSGGGLGTP